MPHRVRQLLVGAGLLALVCLIALGSLGVAPADAAKKRTPCQRWGKSQPTSLQVTEARRTVLCLLNKRRKGAGLPALRRDGKLEAAAQRHTERMDGTGCFAHECPGEPDLEARLKGINYLIGGLLRWAFGENVAWGEASAGTPKAMVAAWMDSPGHRANILNRQYREVGVGFVPGTPEDGDANGGIYTTDFGLAVD
jgi:uncharacterized protein YkwD